MADNITERDIDIYYCPNCSIKHNLPITNTPLKDTVRLDLAGYCFICGAAGGYMGKLPRNDKAFDNIDIFYDNIRKG